jgi:hypothetical protein
MTISERFRLDTQRGQTMIPPRILKELAESLTKQTREGKLVWSKQRHDLQRYITQLPNGQIVVRYDPSRGGADTIELAVTSHGEEVIGSLIAEENAQDYGILADLLFEVQRSVGEGFHRAVTDDILRLLKS